MITFDVVARDPRGRFAAIESAMQQAARSASAEMAELAAREVVATVERETDIRPGIMDRVINTRPSGSRQALVSAVRLALNLSAWNPRETRDGVVADARVGIGPQMYQGALINERGDVVLPIGRRRVPVIGPYTDWLFADVVEQPAFQQWLRTAFAVIFAQEVDNAQS